MRPNSQNWPFDFPRMRARRAIIHVALDRISTSCGYTVPLFNYVAPRDALDKWTAQKDPAELAAYRAEKNATSIDGLTGDHGN